MSDGAIKEVGVHEKLMSQQGLYFDLITAQNIVTGSGGESNEPNIDESPGPSLESPSSSFNIEKSIKSFFACKFSKSCW